MKDKQPLISIVIPVRNEEKLGFLEETLRRHHENPNLEIVVIDGNSQDQTATIAKNYNCQWIESKASMRSQRLNQGWHVARGEIIVFHHPRSLIPKKGFDFLAENRLNLTWGGFQHQFDHHHPLLQFTSWYSNHVRPRTQGIVYLDHCLFAKRQLLEQLSEPLWPEVPIFEDSDFCRKINQFGKPQIIPINIKTSAIRFTTNGLYKQALKNQILKLGYYRKQHNSKMNKSYEKNLNLN